MKNLEFSSATLLKEGVADLWLTLIAKQQSVICAGTTIEKKNKLDKDVNRSGPSLLVGLPQSCKIL